MHATYSEYGSDTDFTPGPERTSVLAIVSLVLGIISIPACILVGLGVIPGVLAILLGIVGLIAIGGSGGRVGGKGVAAGGIATGFVGAVLGAVVLGGGFAMYRGIVAFASDLNQKLVAFDRGDTSAISPALNPNANITEAQLEAFRAAYQAQLGAFVSMPTSIGEIVEGYQAAEQVFQQNQEFQSPGGNIVPLATRFEQGWALVVLTLDTRAGENPPIMNIRIFATDGSLVADLSRASAPPLPGEPAGAPEVEPDAADLPPADLPPAEAGEPGEG